MQTLDEDESESNKAFSLSADEEDSILKDLRTNDFGSRPEDKKKAKAIIMRLNECKLLDENQIMSAPTQIRSH